MQRDCKRGDGERINSCECMPAAAQGKTMFINLVMIPRIPVRLRNERTKCRRANGLGHGRQGRRHGLDPPPAPKAKADYCHIHPWIFSTLWPPYVAFSPLPRHIAAICRCVTLVA